MIVEVDQSTKMEQTNADTVLALSNDGSYAVVVPAAVKRECLALLRKRGKRGNAVTLRLFAAALFVLLEGYGAHAERIVVDTEYAGRDSDIRGMLLGWANKRMDCLDSHHLVFARVGKGSPAHAKAARVAKKTEQPDLVLTTGRLLRLL